MNIGVIGTGDIAAVIVKKSKDAGYPVKMASSKGPDSLRELAAKTGAIPVSVPNVSAKALKWKGPTLRLATGGKLACRSSILRSPNHVGYIFVRIYELQFHSGMTACEDSKDFVCECLPDLIDVPEIKHNRAKPIDT